MRYALCLITCMLIVSGCAHLEVPTEGAYPYRAEFVARGGIKGRSMDTAGAVYLTSSGTGVIQTYLGGGMPSHSIEILSDKLIIRDMWGREMDALELPVKGVAGLIAGDVPSQRYLYSCSIPGGTKVVYLWGTLHVDSSTLPMEVHVSGSVPLDLFFKPAGKNVTMEVRYGGDAVTVMLKILQGGRWTTP